jgi:hypothetical protein
MRERLTVIAERTRKNLLDVGMTALLLSHHCAVGSVVFIMSMKEEWLVRRRKEEVESVKSQE